MELFELNVKMGSGRILANSILHNPANRLSRKRNTQWNHPISLSLISHVLPDKVITQHNARLIAFGLCDIRSGISL